MSSLNVYILTYNRADYLSSTIESVLRQSFKDFQLYILDNHSTDKTKEIVSKFNDDRLHYICHKENIGFWSNFKFAVAHCKADYFVAFHDDDIMMKDCLRLEKNIMDHHPEAALVCGNAEFIDTNGKVTGPFFRKRNTVEQYSGGKVFEAYLNKAKILVFPSIMYRKEYLNKYNVLPQEEAGPCADLVFYSELERYGGTVYELPDILMQYRVHSEQLSMVTSNTMHIQMFQYLKKDNYFSKLLDNNKKGQQYRFRLFGYGLVANMIKGNLDYPDARKVLKDYTDCLVYRRIDFYFYRNLLKFTNNHRQLMKNLFNIGRTVKYWLINIGDKK